MFDGQETSFVSDDPIAMRGAWTRVPELPLLNMKSIGGAHRGLEVPRRYVGRYRLQERSRDVLAGIR